MMFFMVQLQWNSMLVRKKTSSCSSKYNSPYNQRNFTHSRVLLEIQFHENGSFHIFHKYHYCQRQQWELEVKALVLNRWALTIYFNNFCLITENCSHEWQPTRVNFCSFILQISFVNLRIFCAKFPQNFERLGFNVHSCVLNA